MSLKPFGINFCCALELNLGQKHLKSPIYSMVVKFRTKLAVSADIGKEKRFFSRVRGRINILSTSCSWSVLYDTDPCFFFPSIYDQA